MPSPPPLGSAPCFLQALEEARRLAAVDIPVCLLGETGTGKEVFARYMHEISPRSSGPLGTVHCGEIASSMMESELFGHEKGAFTGATSRHKGRFERANGGTVFIDEIGDLHPEVQTKLLRILENKTFERLGGHELISVDFRLISATNADLKARVENGKFRNDLYMRVAVAQVRIPTLRERKEDICVFAAHFAEQVLGCHSIGDTAWEPLGRHDWPGNVRELKRFIEWLLAINGADGLDHGVVASMLSGYVKRVPRPQTGMKPSSHRPLPVDEYQVYLTRLGLTDEPYAEAIASMAAYLWSLERHEREVFLQPHTRIPADSPLVLIVAYSMAVFCLRACEEGDHDAAPLDVAVRAFGLDRLKKQGLESLSPVLSTLKNALRP